MGYAGGNMGMGVPGYGQPGQNPGQWNNYRMQPYNVPRQSIEANADAVFYQHDSQRFGYVPMQMLPSMLQQFSIASGTPCPNTNDIQYLQFTFDIDGDNRISY